MRSGDIPCNAIPDADVWFRQLGFGSYGFWVVFWGPRFQGLLGFLGVLFGLNQALGFHSESLKLRDISDSLPPKPKT